MKNEDTDCNMEQQDKIKAFANECIAEAKENNLQEGDYCLIVYSRSVMYGSKWVKFIYKTIADFESKVLNDIKEIDEMMAIDFEMWIFD